MWLQSNMRNDKTELCGTTDESWLQDADSPDLDYTESKLLSNLRIYFCIYTVQGSQHLTYRALLL